MVLWHRLVRHLAIVGRAIQHGVHPQFVRHLARPLLGHHRPVLLSDADDPQKGGYTHWPRLDLLRSHQLPCHHVVASRSRQRNARVQVHFHRAPRLSRFLVHHLVLSAAARHGLHLLSHLSGRRHPDALAQNGHQTGDDGQRRTAADAAHPSRRHDARGTQSAATHQPQAPGSAAAAATAAVVRTRTSAIATGQHAAVEFVCDGQLDARGAGGGAAVGRPAQQWVVVGAPSAHGQEFLVVAQIGQVRQGEEGGQDAGHCDGCVHHLLVAVLCGQSVVGVLYAVHCARGDHFGGGDVAGMDQFEHESGDLCVLESGLSEVSIVEHIGQNHFVYKY